MIWLQILWQSSSATETALCVCAFVCHSRLSEMNLSFLCAGGTLSQSARSGRRTSEWSSGPEKVKLLPRTREKKNNCKCGLLTPTAANTTRQACCDAVFKRYVGMFDSLNCLVKCLDMFSILFPLCSFNSLLIYVVCYISARSSVQPCFSLAYVFYCSFTSWPGHDR